MSYRTVKRKARVGERILITNADLSGGKYASGDVLTVKSYHNGIFSGVFTEEFGAPYIDHEEYEVIVGTYGDNAARKRIDALESEIETLRGRIAALEKAESPVKLKHTLEKLLVGITETNRHTNEATPNQQRKATIERAKAFVEDVKERAIDRSVNDDGNYTFNHQTTKLTFHVNAEKRVVTALAHGSRYGKLLGKAFAKCAPGDVFNADIGKAIAAGRLYGLDVDEFVNAVQPAEVVVGMRVESITNLGNPIVYRSVTEVKSDRVYGFDERKGRVCYLYKDAGVRYGSPCVNPIITDDTEAQY